MREQSGDFPYFAIYFTDHLHGWATGHSGTVLHTTDGGETWEYQESGTQSTLRDVYFIDNLTGWAVGSNQTIIHTTDGGVSWSFQSIVGDIAEVYYEIYFDDEDTGWTVNNYGEIYHTGDGGATWEEQVRSESTGGPKCLAFVNKYIGFAVLPGPTFLKTTDGGTTWSSMPLTLTCPERQYNPFEPTDLFFTDDQHGWMTTLSYSTIALDSTAIFYTTDGGSNWRCQNDLFIQHFKSVHFVDDLTGWTIGSQLAISPYPHAIFQTTDGGHTWNQQFETEGLPLQDIFFTDAEHGWVIDYRGTVYKYAVP